MASSETRRTRTPGTPRETESARGSRPDVARVYGSRSDRPRAQCCAVWAYQVIMCILYISQKTKSETKSTHAAQKGRRCITVISVKPYATYRRGPGLWRSSLSSSEAVEASLYLPLRARSRPVSSQPACSESGLREVRSALGDSSSGLRHSGLCRSGLSSSLSRLTPAEAKEGCSPLQRPSSVGGCCPYREPRGSARTARPPPPPSRL